MGRLHVAYDVGPLHGPLTGIGNAVAALHDSLHARDDLAVTDYVLSFRAQLAPGTHRLPLPASAAHRLWARTPHPRVDRWLGDAELVHGTNYVVPPTRLPALVSVYDCWFLRNPQQADPVVRRAGAVLSAAIARGAVVHTSSHATEHVVRDLFPGAAVCTVHLGPLPLPPPAGSAPVPELVDRPYVLSIGTLERRKNLSRLVAAFGEVAAGHPDLLLVLAGGPGDDSAAVQAAIDALGPGLAPRVLRTGRVDDAVRSWLLHHAAVLAYPSLDEGFGFPLLDAMQAGVPVVASDAGSIPEVAGDAALCCPADDTAALAAALATVLDQPDRRDALLAAGARRVQQFSWQRCGDEMVALYRRVVTHDLEGLR